MIGIDEVGRGCWAGPLLVVAARQKMKLPDGLDDSKVLSEVKRNSLMQSICETCDLGEGWVSASEIDNIGLSKAMALAVDRALTQLQASHSELVVMDGLINYCQPSYTNVTCVARADSSFPIVSAASIYAKVTRDKYMKVQSAHFPEYGFEKHVGYGTAVHREALLRHGTCALHRKSFKPIKNIELSFARVNP